MTTPTVASPARQAQDLIKAHQQEVCLPIGNYCRTSTDGEAIGRDIGALALREPARAREVFAQALVQAPTADDRREIARGLGQSMPQGLLATLAGNADARAMLEAARGELKHHAGDWAATQIDAALKTVDLKGSAEFGKLDAASQQRVLGTIGYPGASTATIDNVIALAKSGGFQAASPPTRKALLDALAERPNDPIFREALQNIARDPAFAKLTLPQQKAALEALVDATREESYRGRAPVMFDFGGKVVSDADKRQVLANVQKLVASEGFHEVGSWSQRAMLGALDAHATDAAFAGRLVKLVNDPGFRALNDTAKETQLVHKVDDDKSFAAGLDALIGSPRYTALGGAERAKVLADTARLTETKSFKDAKAADRQTMVEIVGDISAQSAARPGDALLRNTLDQVLDGKIKLGLYEREPIKSGGQTFYNWGKANDDGIFLNTHKDVRAAAVAANRYVDTLAHEANHKLNGSTKAGTADRFVDEYRAALVGREAALGRKLTPAEQKRALDNLVDGTNPDYAHLADLYAKDAKFKAAVDGMTATLQGSTDAKTGAVTAPASIEPEDARKRLLDAGLSSDYLKKAGNLDNR